MKFLRNRKTTLAALILASSMTVVGCGGSNANTGGGPSGPVVQNPFAGSFSGQANLGPGQTAFLQYLVGSIPQISGTLNVVGGVVGQNQGFQVFIPNGTVQLQGTVDFTTGAFVLNGNLGGFPITVNGIVNGPFTISYQGQTFSGGPGGPGGGGGAGDVGDVQLITGGSLSQFLFTPGAGFNGPTLVANALSPAGSINRNTATNNFLTVVLSQVELSPFRIDALTLGIFTAGSANPSPQFYPILTSADGDGSIVSLSVTESGGVTTQAWVQGAGTTGGVTINSISQNTANLTFDFNGLVPNPEVAGNSAAGTFSTSGTVDVQFGSILPL